jgi:hypothetical protein
MTGSMSHQDFSVSCTKRAAGLPAATNKLASLVKTRNESLTKGVKYSWSAVEVQLTPDDLAERAREVPAGAADDRYPSQAMAMLDLLA